MSFESASQIVSLIVSLVALGSTFYFWLVRTNRERPNLAVEPLGRITGRVLLPQENVKAYRDLLPADDQVLAAYWFDVTVINNSLLPNAILRVTAEINLGNGEWKPARVIVFDNDSKSALPLNVAPLTSSRLSLELAINLPGDLSGTTSQERIEMAESALKAEPSVRVRLKGVRKTEFEFELSRHRAGRFSTEVSEPFVSRQRRAA